MNHAGQYSKDIAFRADLENARRIAFIPIEHMNRAERRTKSGRKLQAECVKNLHTAVAEIMKEYGIDPNKTVAQI